MDSTLTNLAITEKIKVVMAIRNTNMSELAEKMGTSKQNLYAKFKKNNWTEKELANVSSALGCTFIGSFKFNDSDKIV